MKHRLCRCVMYGTVVFGIVLAGTPLLISNLHYAQTAFLVIGAVLSAIGIVFGLIFLRCNYCGKHLPFRGFSPDYCRHCGEKLD